MEQSDRTQRADQVNRGPMRIPPAAPYLVIPPQSPIPGDWRQLEYEQDLRDQAERELRGRALVRVLSGYLVLVLGILGVYLWSRDWLATAVIGVGLLVLFVIGLWLEAEGGSR